MDYLQSNIERCVSQVNESGDEFNRILIGSDPSTKFYGNSSHESTNGSVEKIYSIIFVRTTLYSHQQSQLQRYIGFCPVLTLGSHTIPILGIRMSFHGQGADGISSIYRRVSKI